MLYRIRCFLAVGLAVLFAACADSRAPAGPEIESPETADRSADSERWSGPLQTVARAIAIGVNRDAAARGAVRDILRDSPWSGHRVTLEELIAADGGDAIVTAAARALGESPDAFRARVEALPAMQFLMPYRAHRRTWHATSGGWVVATLDSEAGPHAVFGSDGRARSIELLSRRQVFFLIKPAEPRLQRLSPQAFGVGEVIQSAGDGTLGAEVPPTVEISPQSHLGSDKTYVEHIYSHQPDGFPDPIVEVELRVEFYAETGQLVRDTTWRLNFEYEDENVDPHTALIAEVLPDSGGIMCE